MLSDTTQTLKQFAASYGSGIYGCGEYQESDASCQTTTDSPLAPITGFLEQPSYVVLPTLLLVAVLIGGLTLLIARKLKRR